MDDFSLTMPEGPQFLTLQMQGTEPHLWAIIDIKKKKKEYKFKLRGTGHDLGDVGNYIGTFQMLGGGLVFHMFEAKDGN